MRPEVKVTMLGGSGSGKTCYLLAMYAAMSMGFRGYTCTADSHDDDLDLSELWDDVLETGLLPDATAAMPRAWPFTFSFGFAEVLGLHWTDYRGGVLTARSDTAEEEVAAVLKLINTSDTVIVCLPADKLVDYCNGVADRGTERDFRKLSQVLASYRHANDRSVPIVIAVTKADIFRSKEERDRAVEEIRNRILHPLFTPGAKWLVMLSFVTLGPKLGRLAVGEKADPAKIEPTCVHLPIMFAIHAALSARYELAQGCSQQAASNLQTAQERQSSFGSKAVSVVAKLFAPGLLARNRQTLSDLQAALGVAEEDCKRLMNLMDFVKQELTSRTCEQLFFFDSHQHGF